VENLFVLGSVYSRRQARNGLRYLLVGGTRQRRFAGTNLKPHNLP
jgi:hypothetical protein